MRAQVDESWGIAHGATLGGCRAAGNPENRRRMTGRCCGSIPHKIVSPMANHSLDILFASLADPTRRAVIERLAHGPAPVKELAQPHDMALPSFLQHIKVMEAGGIITTRKEGRQRMCRMDPNALIPLQGWLEWQRLAWEAQISGAKD